MIKVNRTEKRDRMKGERGSPSRCGKPNAWRPGRQCRTRKKANFGDLRKSFGMPRTRKKKLIERGSMKKGGYLRANFSCFRGTKKDTGEQQHKPERENWGKKRACAATMERRKNAWNKGCLTAGRSRRESSSGGISEGKKDSVRNTHPQD